MNKPTLFDPIIDESEWAILYLGRYPTYRQTGQSINFVYNLRRQHIEAFMLELTLDEVCRVWHNFNRKRLRDEKEEDDG